jgi:type IV secretory pathway VirB10-like protein
MRAHSVCVLSILGLAALVLATQASHARGLAPGEAAPPLQTLDLTKPGPRPSAVTQRAAPPAPAVAAPPVKPPVKEPPATAKAAPAKAKPATLVASGPARQDHQGAAEGGQGQAGAEAGNLDRRRSLKRGHWRCLCVGPARSSPLLV